MSDLLDHALRTARHAASAAAAIIDGYYKGNYRAEIKPDSTPVTQADIEAEDVIRTILQKEFPDHAIYGEEHGWKRQDSEFLWLVDPLDGTKSFVRRNPVFSTQIALMHRGELVLGVSSASQFGQTAWARRGKGAFLARGNGEGEALCVAATAQLSDAAISTGNIKSLARGPRWNAFGELLTHANRARGYGDFLHYHLLAQGSLDVVIESDVNILDIAALAVIVREAGGIFTDLSGVELSLATTSVLATAPALHGAVKAQLEGWNHA
ncbi:MAG: inositol monophosphatase family protein [Lysobacteraceae bacterium]